MFVYRSRFLTRGEVWFDEEPSPGKVDWLYFRQRSLPVSDARCNPFYTVLVDLRKTPAELLATMHSRTARRIREAETEDHLRCEQCDGKDAQLLDRVERMWNEFARAHHTPSLDRSWVDEFSRAGALDIVAAKDPVGNVLAYHLVFLAARRARQLIAISPFRTPSVAWRNAVSRANCLVHWHNFLAYQAKRMAEFDFGGWYPGTTDIQLLGINRFKQSFGGRIVKEFDCEKPVTLRGRILLFMANWTNRERQRRVNMTNENSINATQHKGNQVSPAF